MDKDGADLCFGQLERSGPRWNLPKLIFGFPGGADKERGRRRGMERAAGVRLSLWRLSLCHPGNERSFLGK